MARMSPNPHISDNSKQDRLHIMISPFSKFAPQIAPKIAKKLAGRFILSLSTALVVAPFALAPITAHAEFQMDTEAQHAILIDVGTNSVLYEKGPDERLAPASISKLMTIYVLFEKLSNGSLKLTDTFPVSVDVWRKWRKLDGSKMFLKEGDRVTIENLIQGIIVQSGNDACDVVAEGLAGSQESFAAGLSQKAKELGLNASHFADASGWPDPEQYMTARDISHLAYLLITKFPQYYHYFSEKEYTYAGVRQENRNMLLGLPGVDGLKTGHVDESGYSMVASQKVGDQRLIAVVSGTKSTVARAHETEKLLSWGFQNFKTYIVAKEGQSYGQAAVFQGQQETVPMVATKTVPILSNLDAKAKMQTKIIYSGPVTAPVAKGQPLATMEITGIQDKPIEVPLVAGQAVERLGFFARMKATVMNWIWGPTPNTTTQGKPDGASNHK
jgi:D-alanyl-D-alanine carboxypeptidase (penicillin-binding protein 5/6)